MKLDIIDLKILKALQKNSKITNIELSKVVGLSAAPTLGDHTSGVRPRNASAVQR